MIYSYKVSDGIFENIIAYIDSLLCQLNIKALVNEVSQREYVLNLFSVQLLEIFQDFLLNNVFIFTNLVSSLHLFITESQLNFGMVLPTLSVSGGLRDEHCNIFFFVLHIRKLPGFSFESTKVVENYVHSLDFKCRAS